MSTSFRSQGHSGDESHHYYRQALAPTASDPLQVGDVWSDTTASLLKRCTSVSPVTFVSVEGGSAAHNLFSATHSDGVVISPTAGDILVGNNDTTPLWDRLALGTADRVVKSNGSAPAWGQVGHGELTGVTAADHHTKYTDAEARTASVEDAAYGVGWNGDTTHAPSQNAVYDKVEAHIGAANDHHAQLHAAAHADGGTDELAVQDLASDSATDGQVAKANGSGAVAFEDDKVSINFIIDGGGSAITTGVKGFIEIPFAMTIEGWSALAEQSGSIVVDVWKDTYANFPPVVADTIAGTEKPTITTAVKGQDLTLTTWTTSVAAGDIIGFNVDSITTVTRVTIAIRGKKT